MTTTARLTSSPSRIHADHTVLKHLGDWTEDRSFHVRSRKSTVVLDLRAAGRDEIELLLELDGSTLILLLADDAGVEQWDLHLAGRGRVKDDQAPDGPATVRLHGRAAHSRVVVRRGGAAELASLASLARLREVHHAHQLTGRARARADARHDA
ncbi:MAG: hypothetical protein ACRDN0_07665 [Trebonia sp.]